MIYLPLLVRLLRLVIASLICGAATYLSYSSVSNQVLQNPSLQSLLSSVSPSKKVAIIKSRHARYSSACGLWVESSETVHLSNGIVFKASGTTILKSIVFQSHPNTFLAHWMNLVCVLSLGMKRYRLNTLHTINQCTILSSPLSLLAEVIRPKARFTSSIFKAVLNNSESNGLSE